MMLMYNKANVSFYLLATGKGIIFSNKIIIIVSNQWIYDLDRSMHCVDEMGQVRTYRGNLQGTG